MDKNVNEPVKETENKDNNLTSKKETCKNDRRSKNRY